MSWGAERMPALDAPLDSMRRGLTREFDNAAMTADDPVRAVTRAYDRFGKLIHPVFSWALADLPAGDPPKVAIEHLGVKHHATVGSIEYAAMASEIFRGCGGALATFNVVEIGGGYGGLARVLLPVVRSYTIIDYPEVLRCVEHYLGLSGDQPLRPLLVKHDVPMVYRGVDLVIQTRGFMEMELSEVERHLRLIQSYASGLNPGSFLFTINRARKACRFADYPFDAQWSFIQRAVWPEKRMLQWLLRRTPETRREVPAALRELQETTPR